MNAPGPRRAYSYRTASADYSVSVSTLRRAVEAGKVRTRETPGGVRLNPDDLEREFGFAPAAKPRVEPTPADRALIRELLA